MANIKLHLKIVKGPRHGETIECLPGSLIRIGRILRGNTFAIKDPGISQKHLSFQFDAAAARWTVSDLQTSNGSFLNGDPISPSAPAPLSDGDSIKIGESTSISMSISVLEPEIAEPKEEGRGRGRKPRVPEVELEVEDEMEKMTLGEWFDRMEKYLPAVINEAAEEIIADLRSKSLKFDAFLATNPPH
ncbi:hypothetical protein J5N97_001344 [Dioscorea zingiberensis]|uniref:FHA domain-containing protein n=1 Tax=Dioscorea zingiberensis TaxID=325984 RepID=A0A9D5BUI0_9LILI|nr:hypothetical protein J5N97_001344 [Dioscorea zingiberensis]